MKELIPMYGFDKFWQNEIYGTGVETYCKEPPMLEELANLGNTHAAMWLQACKFPKAESELEFILYVREEEGGGFLPIVQLKLSGDGSRRLFARKDFKEGEVITFVSKGEEKDGTFGLGGGSARCSDSKLDSNAYLTRSGALRCIRPVRAGEEIVRWNRNIGSLPYFERIGLLIVRVTRTGAMVGKVSERIVSPADAFWVEFPDGRGEIVLPNTGYGYVYRG